MPAELLEITARECLACEWLPVESLEKLARHFTPSALRLRRLVERDRVIRALATGMNSTLPARELARELSREISRYRMGRWRFEASGPPPADSRRAQLHRLLTLNEGKPLSAPTLRRVLAGLGAGSKSADFLSHETD